MNTLLRDTETIKAVRIHSFGGPEALYLEAVAPPEPGPGEVLVRVYAAGVNSFDCRMQEGDLDSTPLPQTLGCDFSGVVETLGPGVTDFFTGQSVFGHSDRGGAFAELVVVPVSGLAPKPPSVEDIEAAATPYCALTAWQALFEAGNLQQRQRVLILGAAGGVGMFAVQLARSQGAWVIATDSSRNLPFLRLLGANEAIDCNVSRLEDITKSVDVVVDLVGGETRDRSWKVLKNGGRMVSTVSMPSQEKALLCGVRAWKIQTRTCADQLTLIGELIANGQIKATVNHVLPLFRAPEALELSRAEQFRGQTVLTIDHDGHHPDNPLHSL